MRKYQVFLNDGHTRVYKAKSPTQAKYKYYGSDNHFKTESSVVKVRKYTK